MNEEDLITGGSELDDEERLRLEAELAASLAEEKRLSGIINPEGDSSSTTPQQPQQVQSQPQEIESQVPTEQEQRDPAQAVPTSPFRNPDGTIDYNKIEQYGFEGDVDFLAGLADFGLGALDLIPRVNAPKIPKFQNEYAQMVRDVTSIVVPTMFLGQVGAATLKSKAQGIKFLNDPFVKFLGNTAFQAGVGAFVDRVAPSNETDDNLTGTLKQSWPRVFGWLPDSLATVNGDSPDVKLRKNIVEGVVLGVGLDSLMGLAAKQRAVNQTQELLSFVPENETAKAWFDRNIQIDATPEDVVTRSAAKRSDALDELGQLNFEEAVNADNALAQANRDLNESIDLGTTSAPADVPPPTVEVPVEIDTRGKNTFYHGAADPIDQLEEGYYSGQNIYGEGFYTSDDLTIANSYQRKNKGNSPITYEVEGLEDTVFYDLDQPILSDLKDELESIGSGESFNNALDDLDDGTISTLAEFMDVMRSASRNNYESADTITEQFDNIIEILKNRGFGGFTHVGGKLAGKGNRLHRVNIYWDAPNQVKLKEFTPPSPTKSIHGFTDDYDASELGIRSVDDYGIVGASLDQARIARNADTIYGRVGSVFTDSAIKFINKNGREGEVLIRGQAEILKDAGEYGYKVSDGRYLSHADVVAEGNKLANDFYEMDIAELRASIFPGSIYQGRNVSTGTPELTDEAYAGVMGAIQKYMDDFVNMDEARARSYIGTSVAGQISDTATGMRLTSGSGSMQRAQEQILDRVEFLMAQKGMTSYVRGRSLNMLNLWNRMTVQGSQAYDNATRKRIQNLIKGEKNQTLAAIDRLQLEAKETVDGLRAIKESDPEMLAPLMMAYELTDGNVKSMTSLNNYIKQSSSIWSKAFFDGQPEIPSMINQAFFASVYNHALSALATPIKAGISGFHLLIEKPIRHMAGALYAGARGDKQVIRRAMYQYSSMLDSMERATRYMNQIFKRSAADPFVTAVRDDIGLRNQAQLDIFQSFADAKAAKGEFGPQVLMEQIQAMNDLANHPVLRFGTRSMQAMDGFVQSMIADFEAKGRAFDEITKDGSIPFDAAEADYVASKAHKEMFDENGIIRDEAVNKAAGEISLNLDSASNDALSAFIRRFPILKPFMLFTKTPLNELKLTASYNPLGLFIKQMNQYQLPFDEMPIERVKELLTERGIDVSDPYKVKGKYNELRADIMGRKAIGTVVTFLAVGLYMNDSLTGYGHYNRQVQKVRDNSGYKRLSIKLPDGSYVSYDGLGPVTNYIGLIATIMDNFDVLAPNDPGELLKRAAFTLGASFTDKTFLAGLEPFLDVARGDGGAINRWSSSFLTAAAIPGSSQMAEIGRLLDPGLKLINNDLQGMILNRTPLKGTLDKSSDWIDGGEVNVPDSWFARLVNVYLPWKTSGSISPEKQFLIDVEYDSYATLRTNGRGEKLTNEEQSDLLNTIGQHQLFKRGIQRIMQDVDGKEFRQRFKKAQGKRLRPDTDFFESVHMRLDGALNDAIGDAYIHSRHLTDIRRREELRKRTAEYLMRGQQDKAVEYQEFVRKTLGITLR